MTCMLTAAGKFTLEIEFIQGSFFTICERRLQS